MSLFSTTDSHIYADKRAGGTLFRHLRCQKKRKKRYGQHHRGAIVSLVERKSKLTPLGRVERNTADAVGRELTAQLEPLVVKTITSDNGREFAHHQQVAQHLNADFYFAHPYSSWERGTNENTNGLVRQYFPKKSDFSKITDSQIKKAVDRLNHRPKSQIETLFITLAFLP